MRKVFTTDYVDGKAQRHESYWSHKPMVLCMYETGQTVSYEVCQPNGLRADRR